MYYRGLWRPASIAIGVRDSDRDLRARGKRVAPVVDGDLDIAEQTNGMSLQLFKVLEEFSAEAREQDPKREVAPVVKLSVAAGTKVAPAKRILASAEQAEVFQFRLRTQCEGAKWILVKASFLAPPGPAWTDH